MRVAIIGTGYVGVVSGGVYAEMGHHVACFDVDHQKMHQLRAGRVPFFEPGLSDIIVRCAATGHLRFSHLVEECVADAEVIVLCVGTPPQPDGRADLTQVFSAARQIAPWLRGGAVVTVKSTVPVGTCDEVERIVRGHATGRPIYVASNPEFLAEGEAIANARHPSRVVIGANEPEAADVVRRLYHGVGAPLLVTDRRTAELIKHASNAFLATKISFVNTLAVLCDEARADVRAVARGMGLDPRIGPRFLHAGLGFGGSCFPKDCRSMLHVASDVGCEFDIVAAAIRVNEAMVEYVVGKMAEALGGLAGKSLAILGLSFKPNTSDVRESQALAAARLCCEQGARVRGHDPAAMEAARKVLPEIHFCDDPYSCVEDTDAVLFATDWEEYRHLDFHRIAAMMRGTLVFDGRSFLSARSVSEAGLRYQGVGVGCPASDVAERRAVPSASHRSPSATPVPAPST